MSKYKIQESEISITNFLHRYLYFDGPEDPVLSIFNLILKPNLYKYSFYFVPNLRSKKLLYLLHDFVLTHYIYSIIYFIVLYLY